MIGILVGGIMIGGVPAIANSRAGCRTGNGGALRETWPNAPGENVPICPAATGIGWQ